MPDAAQLLSNSTAGEGSEAERVLLAVFEALMTTMGTLGHSLVIFILLKRRRRQSGGTDALLLALSAADLLLLACLPFHTAAAALGSWPFGTALCKVISFLGAASSSASAFTLATLAVSRYLTVVHSTWAYRARVQRHLRLVVAILWVPAGALAAPQFAFRAMGPSSQLYCFAFLSDVSQLVYSTAHFLLAFVLPLAVIVVMYGRICCFLRTRRRSCRAPQLERYQSQVTRTSGLLVLAFTLCWLPSYVLMFSLLGQDATAALRYGPATVVARLLAVSSTVANPILYVFMSHKFRADLLRLGRAVRCRRCGGPSRCCARDPDQEKDANHVEMRPSPRL